MNKISAVINVVNEEVDVLPRALSSLKNLVDAIVVVDMTSSGKLSGIQGTDNLRVYKHDFAPYVEIARNFGISKATREWILIMDPDEEVSQSLGKIIRKIINDPKADYYRLPRKNIIFGKWIKDSRWWPDYNIRFFKKGYFSWNEIIHSVPVTQRVGADLEAKEENA